MLVSSCFKLRELMVGEKSPTKREGLQTRTQDALCLPCNERTRRLAPLSFEARERGFGLRVSDERLT